MVGVVQRGDADVATMLVRSDTIGDTEVRLGPTLAAADSVIMGTKLTNETSSPSYVTDVVYNVDTTTYWLFLVLAVIVLSLLTTSELISRKLFSLRRVRRHLAKLVKSINWKVIGLIVDQEDHQPSLWSARFLWFHFCIAMFVLIFGYFWNTMSTDITVTKPATYAESIDYFLDTTPEKRRKPIVFENLLFHTAAQRADQKSKLGQLKHIMDTTPGCYMRMNPNDLITKVLTMMSDGILAGKSVLIYPKFAVNSYFERLVCTARPEMMTLIHTSKHSMTPGTLHPVFGLQLPHQMMKYLEYQVRNFLEMHLLNAMLDFVVGQLASDNQLPRTLAYYKCIDHEVVQSDSNLKQYMTLHDIKPAIQVILALTATAVIVLLIETETHDRRQVIVEKMSKKLKRLVLTFVAFPLVLFLKLLTVIKKVII